MSGQSRQFVIRAASSDRASLKYFAGKFPLDTPDLAVAPSSGAWMVQKATVESGPTDPKRPHAPGTSSTQWHLQSDERSYTGLREGGMSGSYFLLVKHRGSDDLMALPVDDWYSFRPDASAGTGSLEEAEAKMAAMRRQQDRVHPRLMEMLGTSMLDDEEDGGVSRDENDAESDEEWKTIKSRAAALKQTKQPAQPPPTEEGGEEREEDAEDWEHENEAADDDLDMGESEEEAEPAPAPRRVIASDSEEDGEAGAGGDKSVRSTLRRMMRLTGLEESEGEEEEEEGALGAGAGPSEDESDEDLSDLSDEDDLGGEEGKAPAQVVPPAMQRERSGSLPPLSRKRKSPPPPAPGAQPVSAQPQAAEPRAQQRSPSPAPAGVPEAGKRARISESASTASLGRSASPVLSSGGSASKTPPGQALAGGAPAFDAEALEAEVVALMRARGKISLREIVETFKTRVGGGEGSKLFTGLVRKVAKLDPAPSPDGVKYLVLR